MFIVNRNSLQEYARTIKALTNEELCKEIWMLEDHIKYLCQQHLDSCYFDKFLFVAKEEKEARMISQGCQ